MPFSAARDKHKHISKGMMEQGEGTLPLWRPVSPSLSTVGRSCREDAGKILAAWVWQEQTQVSGKTLGFARCLNSQSYGPGHVSKLLRL